MTAPLADCPELRTRAEDAAKTRHQRLWEVMTSNGGQLASWEEMNSEVREASIDAVAAELADLSTLVGRDHGLRWLWQILTYSESAWCPSWTWDRKLPGYRISPPNVECEPEEEVVFLEPGPEDEDAVLYAEADYFALRGITALEPLSALHAALVAALAWGRTHSVEEAP